MARRRRRRGRHQKPLQIRTRRRDPERIERRRRRAAREAFWGDAEDLPDLPAELRLTAEPDAVVRSLGDPPLPGHEAVAQHYFAAVYDRAVNMAGALAAVGGLIDPEQLSPGSAED